MLAIIPLIGCVQIWQVFPVPGALGGGGGSYAPGNCDGSVGGLQLLLEPGRVVVAACMRSHSPQQWQLVTAPGARVGHVLLPESMCREKSCNGGSFLLSTPQNNGV